MKKDILRK